jgi:hypothetical protein
MGDRDGGLYVSPEIPEAMRGRLLPRADVLTPNHFELEQLAGGPARTLSQVLDAAAALRRLGPSLVLVTSLLLAQPARAASDENVLRLMDLVIAMSGVPSASVPLNALINTRNRSTIDEFLIDMPWWAEKLGAVDRHITSKQLLSSELNTPGITDFSGNVKSEINFFKGSQKGDRDIK